MITDKLCIHQQDAGNKKQQKIKKESEKDLIMQSGK